MEKVKNLLAYILNPKRNKISKRVLIDTFHYPVANLDEIDLDWL